MRTHFGAALISDGFSFLNDAIGSNRVMQQVIMMPNQGVMPEVCVQTSKEHDPEKGGVRVTFNPVIFWNSQTSIFRNMRNIWSLLEMLSRIKDLKSSGIFNSD